MQCFKCKLASYNEWMRWPSGPYNVINLRIFGEDLRAVGLKG